MSGRSWASNAAFAFLFAFKRLSVDPPAPNRFNALTLSQSIHTPIHLLYFLVLKPLAQFGSFHSGKEGMIWSGRHYPCTNEAVVMQHTRHRQLNSMLRKIRNEKALVRPAFVENDMKG